MVSHGGIIATGFCATIAIVSFQLVNGLFHFGNYNRLSSGYQNEPGKQVRLLHYTGSDINSASITAYTTNNADELLPNIISANPMTLYIHGFQETPHNESIRTVANAYLIRGDHNFILLDWSDFAYDPYLLDLLVVKDIARDMATILDRFIRYGLSSEALHIVGHSMGGQMAGFVGNYTNFIVPRISALDPASPGYYLFGAEHLNPSNARFVDVIHTDGGFYGALSPTGTVDCYANTGTRPQPNCALFGILLTPRDLCSHWRSWRIWAESLLNEEIFMARKCASYDLFLGEKCDKNEIDYCGYKMENTKRGVYYFTTNAASPFGRGVGGLRVDR